MRSLALKGSCRFQYARMQLQKSGRVSVLSPLLEVVRRLCVGNVYALMGGYYRLDGVPEGW